MHRDLLNRFFGRTQPAGPSIYDHVRSHLRPDGPGLTEGGETLPDEPEQAAGPLRWAPGALDGVSTNRMGNPSDERRASEVFRLVQRAAAGGDKDLRALERHFRSLEPLSIVDPLIRKVAESPQPAAAIGAIGRNLATRSGSRNAVKIGITLLGAVPTDGNRSLLLTLGRHDEFTLYSAVALANTEADPEGALWELAKLVDGWGRIHVVERLKETSRAEIQGWILRVGFRNSVMNEYLAYIAATTGGLVSALDCEQPDDEVLDAACDIVSALIEGGPAEDIDDYGDASRAVELLIGHLERRAATTRQFLTLQQLEGFLGDQTDGWAAREQHGWPSALRDELRARCRKIEARPAWRDVAVSGLESDDPVAFHEAARVCLALGIDTLEVYLRHAAGDSSDFMWFTVMEVVDEARLPEVLAIAERSLPLTEIASGPLNELGLGPTFGTHSALGFVVQGLRRFPGQGWPLIVAALRSPVINNRNMALSVLEAWNRSAWPAEAAGVLRFAALKEPNAEVRVRMNHLARGEVGPVTDGSVP